MSILIVTNAKTKAGFMYPMDLGAYPKTYVIAVSLCKKLRSKKMQAKNLWEKVEKRIEKLEYKFANVEGKKYDPDDTYRQARTKYGLYYHAQIKALADLMQDDIYETKSIHRELY